MRSHEESGEGRPERGVGRGDGRGEGRGKRGEGRGETSVPHSRHFSEWLKPILLYAGHCRNLKSTASMRVPQHRTMEGWSPSGWEQ